MDRKEAAAHLAAAKPVQPRIACFDYVSADIFAGAVKSALAAGALRDAAGQPVSALPPDYIENALAARRLPVRATAASAGYDFFSPVSFRLLPGDSVTIPTGVRCAMDPGWVLIIAPKSGKGCRFRLMLRNTVALIDADYYGSDNEGHIVLLLANDNREGLPLDVQAGDSLVQGVFLPYGVTADDEAGGVRNGGFGSTVR